jgi:hypothetical protein
VESRSTKLAVLFCVVLVLGVLFSGSASAHHKSGHSRGGGNAASDHDGDADSDPGTHYTEDNDGNDGGTPNNQPDAGDNAHPSGKDKSVEHGNSGNQGNSESDPDDDGRGPDRSNGGPDKPNGSGGRDLADQDGNNGCGNDDDFEDDNEGWCGKPESPGPNEENPPGGNPNPPPDVDSEDSRMDVKVSVDAFITDAVLGSVVERSPSAEVDAVLLRDRAASAAPGDTSPEAISGAPLPFTGGSLGEVFIGALAAIAAGLVILRFRRSH